MSQVETPEAPTPAEQPIGQDIERLFASARDALTDDTVTRLSATVAGALDLVDRVNRSDIARALPAITQLTESGDLDRLVGLARLFAAIQDSLSDDIVHRLALLGTGMASLADRLACNDRFLELVELLGREDVQCAIADFAEAACAARDKVAEMPPAKGGIGGLWQTVREPGMQQALRYMVLLSDQFRNSR